MRPRNLPAGSALVITMIALLVFTVFAAGVCALSGATVQVAENQRQVNHALMSAQSGLELVRYYFNGVTIPGSVAPEDRLQRVAQELQSTLYDAGVYNVTVSYNDDAKTLTVPAVTLNSETAQTFSVTMGYGADYDTLAVTITGNSRHGQRHIQVDFSFATFGSTIFDFGIATKGPLRMQGNVDVEGYNENIEASVYIESYNDILALEMIGKSAIAGEVSIANPMGIADISNPSSICGDTGEAAYDHVHVGVPPSDFPSPCPANFEQHIDVVFDPASDPTENVTLTNIEIPADANPSFSGNCIIQGIMFVRNPNIVTFTGNAEIIGLIVADGCLDNPSPENQIQFQGTVNSYGVSELPDEGFSDLKEETGTFLLAPGFSVSFGGDFETINGVIAASGVEFFGNAGGVINGSVVNYSNTPMTLEGNTDLIFNRSGIEENPAGFEPTKVLQFIPTSYSEPML